VLRPTKAATLPPPREATAAARIWPEIEREVTRSATDRKRTRRVIVGIVRALKPNHQKMGFSLEFNGTTLKQLGLDGPD
jgi:hypothetical protein